MTSIKLFTVVTFFTVAFSSPLSYFYYYPLIPYSAISSLRSAHKYCPNNTNVEKYGRLFKEAEKCYGDLLQGNHSICYSFEINVARCSQPLVDYFVDCLPEKSKDIPPALVKGAASVIETFCTSSGELLLEAVNMCIYDYVNLRNVTTKEECKRETLQPKLDKLEVESPSKSEVCKVVKEIGDCWQDYINGNCESSKAKELFSTFYNAAFSACKK